MGTGLKRKTMNASPMKREPYRILVSGVGAIIGYGVVKSIRMCDLPVRIVGIDSNPRAAGFHFSDLGIRCPSINDKDYRNFIIRLCNRERIDLIIPAIEQDVDFHFRHGDDVKRAAGVVIALNTPAVYAVARDKWSTYCFMKKNQIPVPKTVLSDDPCRILKELRFPFLLKPRVGQAGKGIVKIECRDDLDYWIPKSGNSVAQEYIGRDDEEYTVGVFGLGEGRFEGPIIMKRKLNYGSTFEAEVDKFPKVGRVVRKVLAQLKPVGSTNIQIRLDRGVPKVLEINPRVSSSCSLRAAFGFNESEMAIRYYLLGEKEFNPVLTRGYAVRYIEDLTFDEGIRRRRMDER
jgi:carbamoyl-phosphate synthase large subunit